MVDLVNTPPHYLVGGIEAIDVINKINEKARRIKEADEILKNICLN